MGGELLDRLANVCGEELVDKHEFGQAEVQVAVVAGRWWRLSAVACSDNRPRSGGGERRAGGRWRGWGHRVPSRRGGRGGGETRKCGRGLVL